MQEAYRISITSNCHDKSDNSTIVIIMMAVLVLAGVMVVCLAVTEAAVLAGFAALANLI